jgi:cation diffusion facilitator family transporter
MKKLTHWTVAKFIKNHQEINYLKVRARYGALEGWVSIVGNTLLFAIKLIAGLSIGSVSLIADAVHTLSDSATSVVVIIGFKMAKKPSDREHPFGHGRMEFVATLIVSVLLFIAGVELLEKSIHSIIHPQAVTASVGIILIIAGTILAKELMSRFSYELGEMIDSKTLKADALHHRSDAVSTVLVVVALVASRFGVNRIDGIMGVFVALIIFYSGYEIAKGAVSSLLGEAPSRETIEEIARLARKHEGVLGVHDIVVHEYGQTRLISLHIEVFDKENASRLHELSEAIEDEVGRKMNGKVVVHVDPINKDHPEYDVIEQTIRKIISEDNRVHSFHELRIVGCDVNRCNVIFEIALEEDADEQETYDIIHYIQEKFKKRFPEMKTVIKAEPKYAYT